jgi:hypothetical protein
MSAAAEAVIEAFIRAYRKGGRFLIVKRTATLVFTTRFFKRYAIANDFAQVYAIDQIINKVLWNTSCHERVCDLPVVIYDSARLRGVNAAVMRHQRLMLQNKPR